MTEQQAIAHFEAENARLRAKLPLSDTSAQSRSMYDLVKNDARFKTFCRRRSTVPRPTLAEVLDAARKRRTAEIRAGMKPKGIWSLLKDGPYWTGRLTNDGPEALKIRRFGNDWISEDPWVQCEIVPQNVPNFGEDPKIEPESDETEQEAMPDEAGCPLGDDLDWAIISALAEQNILLRAIAERHRGENHNAISNHSFERNGTRVVAAPDH